MCNSHKEKQLTTTYKDLYDEDLSQLRSKMTHLGSLGNVRIFYAAWISKFLIDISAWKPTRLCVRQFECRFLIVAAKLQGNKGF